MKERLYCRIFGHKFVSRHVASLSRSYEVFFFDKCINCGLSKEELRVNCVD